ncbi:MAG: VanZ like family [Rhodospirillales bacterium]|jgi:VanZ family protein|nr:VanZ like family [Rhodospirillales bacterium]
MSPRSLEMLLRLARLGAAVSLTATVAGMLVPGHSLPQEMPPDLLLHFLGFGVPAMFASLASRGGRSLFHAIAIVALAALVSEAAQWLVPGRTVSVLDLAADAVGIACGVCLGRMAQLLLLGLAGAPRLQS